MTNNSKSLLVNLQSLRAVAALNVVFFHILYISDTYGHEGRVSSFFSGWGANGVDIFFVLSGFIMLYTQQINRSNVSIFILKRLIRIVPMYWLLTSLIIVIYLTAPAVFREMEINYIWASVSFLFSSNLIMDKAPLLHVGWTLEWELLFYLIFGLSLSIKSLSAVSIVNIFALIILSFVTKQFLLLEFAAGIIIAWTFNKKPNSSIGPVILCLGVIIMSLSLFDWVKAVNLPRVIIWGLPSVLIVYGCVNSKQIHSYTGQLLGNSSYSIYLIQIFTIPIFYKFIALVEIGFNSDILALLCLLFTAITGVFCYYIFEKPISRALVTVLT